MKGIEDKEPQGYRAQRGFNVSCVLQNNFHTLGEKAIKSGNFKEILLFSWHKMSLAAKGHGRCRRWKERKTKEDLIKNNQKNKKKEKALEASECFLSAIHIYQY